MGAMKTMTAIPTLALAAAALLSVGCASAPGGVRGEPSLQERAEKGPGQAEACIALSHRLWERDRLESLRYLRRGAGLRDADACKQYLARAESAPTNQSQRVYARLYVEGLLRRGPILNADGSDVRAELYYQLCWAWRYTEPANPAKAGQVLASMVDAGMSADMARTPFIAQLLKENGLRLPKNPVRAQDVSLFAGETADAGRSWLRLPLAGDASVRGDWALADVQAWGGGSDRLLIATNVLAFVVNCQGEPSFRGRSLWIVNLGAAPVYLSAPATGHSNYELLPGREELLTVSDCALERGDSTTGVSLSIKYRRIPK